MNMSLTDDQLMLKDSAERWVRDTYAATKRSHRLKMPDGLCRESWRSFAALGWIGLTLPEEDGGLAGSDVDLMVLMEELGRGLVLEPYVGTAVLCGGLIAMTASEAQRRALLPDLVAGRSLFALAHTEHAFQHDPFEITTTATPAGDGYRLNGRKAVILDASSARHLIVVARTSGSKGDIDGLSLLVVDADAGGLVRSDYRTLDGRRAADLSLENVRIPASSVLGTPGLAGPPLARALNRATIAICAEAVGAMAAALAMTRDYVAQRRQFGVPIGSFQVIQHRLADMFMDVELCRSIVWLAAMTAADEAGTAAADVAAARVVVGAACRRVAADVIQLHGGIGMTEEYAIGHYAKRLKAIEIWLKCTEDRTRAAAGLSHSRAA